MTYHVLHNMSINIEDVNIFHKDFGVEKFSNLKNFWNNPQPNKDFGF